MIKKRAALAAEKKKKRSRCLLGEKEKQKECFAASSILFSGGGGEEEVEYILVTATSQSMLAFITCLSSGLTSINRQKNNYSKCCCNIAVAFLNWSDRLIWQLHGARRFTRNAIAATFVIFRKPL